jgi:hypothetical protein
MQTPRSTRRLLALAAAIACVGMGWAGTVAAPAVAQVPEDFHGVVAQTQLDDDDVTRLRNAEVGTMRFIINWPSVEPERGRYDFREADRWMINAARTGADPLPFVYGTPGWADPDAGIGELIATSEGQKAWRQLLRALAFRYGPNGYFWPLVGLDGGVDIWQIGNEPNLYSFWGGEPSPSGYALLLGIGADAIRSIDPGAEIAMAGLPPGTRGPDGWEYLDDLLDVEGVEEDFDYIAPHPYSADMKGVTDKLDRFRKILVGHGLGNKRMLVTEIGWMAGGPKDHLLRRSRQGQAKILKQAYARLAAKRARWGIDSVLWFAFQDRAEERGLCSFCARSGLFDAKGRAKPAWDAFRDSATALRR